MSDEIKDGMHAGGNEREAIMKCNDVRNEV